VRAGFEPSGFCALTAIENQDGMHRPEMIVDFSIWKKWLEDPQPAQK
jgi:hypothetical protein